MADQVTLLTFWASPFGMRVRIALAEKGVECEIKEENLAGKSPLLVQMNPVHQKIPVLIHNGKPVCESLIIIQYIDEAWPDKGPRLLPADPYARANARFWADFIDKKLYDSWFRIFKTKGDEQVEATKETFRNFELLEEELGEKAFFGGDEFGYLDVALAGHVCWFNSLEEAANFKFEEKFGKLAAWVKRCMEKKSLSETLPHEERIIEYVGQAKKRLGVE